MATQRPQRPGGRPDSSTPRAEPATPPFQEAPPAGARLPDLPGYELLREVGRGGMAVVYEGRQLATGRPVAVKLLIAGDMARPTELARFEREAEIVRQLRHPHIVEYLGGGVSEGRPFLALEYVQGGTLARRLAAGRVKYEWAVETIKQVAGAVAAAHAAGVVHRDLKPANILLTPDGRPKVADFGLARTADSGMTTTNRLLGTPSYMAPEQVLGQRDLVGPATDVWALGVMLYELLTGVNPFRGGNQVATLRQVIGTEPERADRVETAVPAELAAICANCLQKSVAARYSSAYGVITDLFAWQAGGAGAGVRRRPTGRV